MSPLPAMIGAIATLGASAIQDGNGVGRKIKIGVTRNTLRYTGTIIRDECLACHETELR